MHCWQYLALVSLLTGWCKARPDRLQRIRRTLYYPQCPPGCTSCSSANGCVTCQSGLFLFLHRSGMRQTGWCYHSCPSGYYESHMKNFGLCQKCRASHCEACFSRSHCSRCTHPYYLHQGACIDQCPNGLYYDALTKRCVSQVNCEVSEWTLWGPCHRKGQTCGYKYGSQTRNRNVIQPPSPNGEKCPNRLSEQGKCRMKFRKCEDLECNSSDLSKRNPTRPCRWKKSTQKKRRRKSQRNQDKKRRNKKRLERRRLKRKRKKAENKRRRTRLPEYKGNHLRSPLMVERAPTDKSLSIDL